MRSRLISMEEEVEFHHEQPRLRFSAKPLTPESLDDSDDYSGVVFDFELKIRSAINHRYYDVRSSDDVGTRRRSFLFQSYEPGEKTVFFDQRMLTTGDRKITYEMLSSYLRSFGITRSGGTGDLHDRIVDEIIDRGSELRPIDDPTRTRKVLGLYVEISGDYFKYRCEECRARMTEMVPASSSSIKKALKAVVVGRKRGRDGEESGDVEGRKRKRVNNGVSEGESCTVCMEEFKGGSKVACMPCKHVFHSNCIVKWLRQSRHCPVCRFEVSV